MEEVVGENQANDLLDACLLLASGIMTPRIFS